MKNQHISLADQIQETSNGEDEEIKAKAVDAVAQFVRENEKVFHFA